MGESLTEKQQEARIAILQDAAAMRQPFKWSWLHRRGHHFKQVMACVHRGDMTSTAAYEFELTEAGRAALREQKDASHE